MKNLPKNIAQWDSRLDGVFFLYYADLKVKQLSRCWLAVKDYKWESPKVEINLKPKISSTGL